MTRIEHRQGDSPTPEQNVYLPALLSDEFGVSQSVAREQIALGMVTIDGEEWTGDKLTLPREEIRGKLIEVKGRDRSFRMVYVEGESQ